MPKDGHISEREEDVLRLLMQGHEVKSIAATLGLSVHAVNERLRDARRKLGASSSREAARRYFQDETSAETVSQISRDRYPGLGAAGEKSLMQGKVPSATDARRLPVVFLGSHVHASPYGHRNCAQLDQ